MKANLRNLVISMLGLVLGLIAAPGFALQFPDEGRPSRHHPVRGRAPKRMIQQKE
jgi:hypothetical protein